MKCGKSSGMVHGCKMDYGSRELSLGGTEYIPLDEVGTDNFKREPVETSRQPDHNTSRHGKDFFSRGCGDQRKCCLSGAAVDVGKFVCKRHVVIESNDTIA